MMQPFASAPAWARASILGLALVAIGIMLANIFYGHVGSIAGFVLVFVGFVILVRAVLSELLARD